MIYIYIYMYIHIHALDTWCCNPRAQQLLGARANCPWAGWQLMALFYSEVTKSERATWGTIWKNYVPQGLTKREAVDLLLLWCFCWLCADLLCSVGFEPICCRITTLYVCV